MRAAKIRRRRILADIENAAPDRARAREQVESGPRRRAGWPGSMREVFAEGIAFQHAPVGAEDVPHMVGSDAAMRVKSRNAGREFQTSEAR